MNSLNVTPPGGWRWKCPIHGVSLKADFFDDLLVKVIGYLRANKLTLHEDMVAGLQDDMCKQNGWGEPVCRQVEG